MSCGAQDDFTPEQNAVNQNLFEDQQQMLESEVERLSNLVRRLGHCLIVLCREDA